MAAQYLEWREKQYDLRVRVDMFGKESSEAPIVKGALTYIATEDRTKNLNYLGIAPGEVIAQQIASAVGPSGPNYEYLYGLAQALEKVRHLLLPDHTSAHHLPGFFCYNQHHASCITCTKIADEHCCARGMLTCAWFNMCSPEHLYPVVRSYSLFVNFERHVLLVWSAKECVVGKDAV